MKYWSVWGWGRFFVLLFYIGFSFIDRDLLDSDAMMFLIVLMAGSYGIQCALGQKPKSAWDRRQEHMNQVLAQTEAWSVHVKQQNEESRQRREAAEKAKQQAENKES